MNDAIHLNPKLFARVDAIYRKRDTLGLDPEVEDAGRGLLPPVRACRRASADADKAKLRELNKQISTLETAFEQKLLAAGKEGALVVDSKDELAGLSDGEIDAAAHAAESRKLKGKWLLPLQNTTQQPTLHSLSDRATREKLFDSAWTRAEKGDANDTRDTIATIASCVHRRRSCSASRIMRPTCSKTRWRRRRTPSNKFLAQLIPATTAEGQREAAEHAGHRSTRTVRIST